uniref:Uncharacterized protein n=1 Tax=Caenorhabditis japonica TaxID=281687 RepID=A0A8R1HM13_CAEJA
MVFSVVSALPHSTVHTALLSRRHRSVICAGPYEILPLETCPEPLPSTSSLSEFPIECLQLSTDERTIGLATNSILKVVDITTGHESRNLTGHTLPITSLSASKFSPYCWYTGSSDCTWTQWDTRMHQSKIYGSKTSGVVRSLALSPGDHYVAIGTDDNIQIFDARQRDIIKQFNCSGHTLELHPSDVLLSAVGHDRIVRFFCLENFELISQSDPFLDDIQASAFDKPMLGSFRPKPSPSMSDLRTTKTSSIAGSTQSLISDKGPKTRSASKQRNQEPITITYLGRPRTPSEGDVSSSIPIPPTRRRPSPVVKKASTSGRSISVSSAPVRKQYSASSSTSSTSTSAAFGAFGFYIDTIGSMAPLTKGENQNLRRLKMMTSSRRPLSELPADMCSDEALVLTSARILSQSHDWTLNTCHAYITTIVDNLTSVDETNRTTALSSLEAISFSLLERLVKFAEARSHRIGVDVAAEERTEKAKYCIQHLRAIVKKRDWYYKQLDANSVQRLDLCLEQLKKI